MKQVLMSPYALALSLLVSVGVNAEETLFTASLKNGENVDIVALDAQDTPTFAQAKHIFMKSFSQAYKDYSAEQLYLPAQEGFLKSFLDAAFEDEETDFNASKKDAYFIVAKSSRNDQVIGFVAYDKKPSKEPASFYIRQLAIDPAYWRQGLGKLLCIDTIRHIVPHGTTVLSVCTRKVNEPAVTFYHNLSFKDASMEEVHPELPAYKYQGFTLVLEEA